MNLLAIETSTEFLSLAVCRGDALHVRHEAAGQRHAELILDGVASLLRDASLQPGDLEGIAYGEGPGSFTGLRIGCGVAQGLALACGLKVIGVSTLLALAEESPVRNAYACIDARMGEVYCAAFQRHGDQWQVAQAPSLSAPRDVPVPQTRGWSGIGSGFAAYEQVLRGRLGATLERVEAGLYPTAAAVLRLALPRFLRAEGRPPEEASPVYVRDKVALKKGER